MSGVTLAKVYPLPLLPDFRKPEVTSSFKTKNPSRPKHDGADFFYRYDPKRDPPVKMGDGAATRGPDGKPKWFIPFGTQAIAAADGVVQIAGITPTGYRVWIRHADGMRTGYFHLRGLHVKVGAVVSMGYPLGEVGDNPRDVDAQHLHFEVSPAGIYIPSDPEAWLHGAKYFGG